MKPVEARTGWPGALVECPLRTVLVAVLATCVAGVAALTAWVTATAGHVGLDRRIAVSVAYHRTAPVTTVMAALTRLGSGPAAGLVLLVLGVAAIRGCDSRAFRHVGAAVLAATVTSQGLKHLVGRPRPGQAFALEHLGSASFPSGHATMAAALWGSLALTAWARRPTPRSGGAFGAVWVLIVVAVAASRVELGVHWATDVVAGALLGTACAAATAMLLRVGQVGQTRAEGRTGSRSKGPAAAGVAIRR